MKYLKKFYSLFNMDIYDEDLSDKLIKLIEENGVKYVEYGLFYILFEIPNNGKIYLSPDEDGKIVLHHGSAESFVKMQKTLKGTPYRYQKNGNLKSYFSTFTEELSDLIFSIIEKQAP